jgi:hypothetical protein
MLRGPFGLSLIHLVATAAIALAQYHLLEVRVAGNQQLRAEDIIAASRLRMGQRKARRWMSCTLASTSGRCSRRFESNARASGNQSR